MADGTAPSTAFRKVPSAVLDGTGSVLAWAASALESFLTNQRVMLPLWIPVFLGTGIAVWFALAGPAQWGGFISVALAIALLASTVLKHTHRFALVRRTIVIAAFLAALGCALVWSRSARVGAEPLQRPQVLMFHAEIRDRTEMPARKLTRLILRTDGTSALPLQLRVNIPQKWDNPGLRAGAVIRIRARLMPPAGAALPGAYNFARRVWFEGISATGSALGPPEIISGSRSSDMIGDTQARLSRHIQSQVAGSEGAIAATLATGDRGGIAEDDAEAMRRAGLAHLLSISGLHVSAVVGAVYLLVIRLLALSPALALRYRLPILASIAAAGAGLLYTLLTGAEVPTIRACIAALLVLTALSLGRDPLSMRLVAAGATFVLVIWPESLVGPSFQLSFAAVTTIIALHQLPWIKRTFERREEHGAYRIVRFIGMLFITGLAIEIVLMPIALYHFHKAGIYGALANIVAIPLTTFVIMPLEALALAFDTIGLGAPLWYVCGKSLSLLLGLAHFVESRPGSITRLPSMGVPLFTLFVSGGLWILLLSGKARLAGFVPVAIAAASLPFLKSPDILVHSNGTHLAITQANGDIVLLRDRAGDYTVDSLMENAGLGGRVVALRKWENAQCNPDFCSIAVVRRGRTWTILASRSSYIVPEMELAAACKRVDIVISNRWLPYSCKPKWLKADRKMLSKTGGLSIWLDDPPVVESVAESEGQHGWFRPS